MVMMMAVIHVLFGQQTQQGETSIEADRDTDLSHLTLVCICTHLWTGRRTLKPC